MRGPHNMFMLTLDEQLSSCLTLRLRVAPKRENIDFSSSKKQKELLSSQDCLAEHHKHWSEELAPYTEVYGH